MVGTVSPRVIVALCFAVALMEGFDLQSAGVAAPLLKPALKLSPAAFGAVASAAIIGLIVGALAGGRLSDKAGRRASLLLSVGLFAIFSLVTAAMWDFDSMLVARFLTGVGLGGALPNIVAIAAETASKERAATTVALTYAGMPIGGGLSAIVSLIEGHDWRTVFIVGGIIPLLLLPVLASLLPALRVTEKHATLEETESALTALFARGALGRTVALWVAAFFGLLVLYLLLNWLPALLVQSGIGRGDALVVQLVFNLAGATVSYIAGTAMDRRRPRLVIGAVTVTLVAGLAAMASPGHGVAWVAAAVALAGAGVMALQAVAYGIAPQLYPARVRGVGVGATVAVGRCGSVAGPLLAGWLVAAGYAPGVVFMTTIPAAVACGLALLWLAGRRQRA